MAKQTKLRKQQLRRIHDIIARAEKKGYTFGSFKEDYKSYSTQKLKSLTVPQIKSQAEYIPNFTDMVLKNIEEMIQEGMSYNIRTGIEESATSGENARYLLQLLGNEITAYGRDKVAIACENAPDDLIVYAHETIYASSTTKCVRHGQETIQLIRGYIPTLEQAKEDEEYIENSVDIDDDENPFT